MATLEEKLKRHSMSHASNLKKSKAVTPRVSKRFFKSDSHVRQNINESIDDACRDGGFDFCPRRGFLQAIARRFDQSRRMWFVQRMSDFANRFGKVCCFFQLVAVGIQVDREFVEQAGQRGLG